MRSGTPHPPFGHTLPVGEGDDKARLPVSTLLLGEKVPKGWVRGSKLIRYRPAFTRQETGKRYVLPMGLGAP